MILQDKFRTLCYFGLLPFVSIPMLAWISPNAATKYQLVFHFFIWSLMMAMFMAGTLWGIAIKQKRSAIESVGIFLILLFIFYFNIYGYGERVIFVYLMLLIAYELIYFSEKKLINNIDWYKELRFHLTFSIRICHLLMIGFIFTNQ